ncbi:recombinase family protein [Pseudotabrizicola alkalilacus]|uniref:Recombinase family protein n=1 Tax=Pseudotabrizicola alkalilacus TaxID=2305252 RepID=A0A411YWN3_9RHOB|nr:recombinase family protein [Pseudotabrizicola alkalilacus]RGP35143.1 recombinase family protein [Pseudotabrizicola alkalilacus]
MLMRPTLRKAAIYARYSTDMQSDASIDDQFRVCRRLIDRNGWTVIDSYSDAALSGASLLRPDYQRLLADARTGRFDVVVAEGLDRFSRDQEHIAAFYKQMSFHGIPIVTAAEGEISELHIGLKGTMSALFLKDLAQKTHRGLEGRVAAGLSAGGICYGYSVKRELRADGTVTTGERLIVPEEAATVLRIFNDYDAGLSARAIAAALNHEGVPSPRSDVGDGTWGASTISGNWKRGTGILNNELYIGILVWNRQRFVKDPHTFKRQARLNPPEAWKCHDVPDLRIIDDALWDRVKARQGAIRAAMNPAGVQSDRPRLENARRPAYLLAGLMKCACCGASYTLINKNRYGCATPRNKGESVCSNRATILREEVEARVLIGLRQSLLHPDLITVFVEEYRRAFNAAASDAGAGRETAQRGLAKAEKKIASILTAIEDGMYHPSMKEKMSALEQEKAELKAFLADRPAPPALRLHPRMSDLYREKITDLAAALNQSDLKPQATELLRGLISEARMVPTPDAPGGHEIELVGDLAGILQLSEADMTKPPRMARAGVSDRSVTMVAGTRFQKFLPLHQVEWSRENRIAA